MYYFGLPDGWTPEQVPNKAALGLLRRFVHNGCASPFWVWRRNIECSAQFLPVVCVSCAHTSYLQGCNRCPIKIKVP